MNSNFIDGVILDVPDLAAARRFYSTVFGLDSRLGLRAAAAPGIGFRGYVLSLTVTGPATVDGFVQRALVAGATLMKPAAKFLSGYSAVVQAPDGALWRIVSLVKKDNGPDTRRFDLLTLVLGVADIKSSKRYYISQGLPVRTSYGSVYVEFDAGMSPVKLALYRRRALAKEAGVFPEGTGSHGLTLSGGAAPFTDPDGFTWETTVSRPAPPTPEDEWRG